ncbi:MAG: Fe-S cluster assembly ATPase SufC [Candidatus Marinimicrobia bacterium]|nr:Fe-S cluster assembly ATPase SufC [Candidatus Neomarinimicrobiota bacterium]|tara:strand:+ start:5210 stop:5962 length:753 start_codon:yes stop_codon:yes gene_type:complete
MITFKDLVVDVEGKRIINEFNLKVSSGELHVIMGPNGSGKSTIANTIAGHPRYSIKSGDIVYKKELINELSPEERAAMGIFLSLQYPVSIPGVKNIYFLKAAVNSIRKIKNQDEIDTIDFLKMVRGILPLVGLDESFLHRSVNEGFSGGEKKRNEILQMLVLQPDLSVLDETDSGLDIDALKIIAEGIKNYRNDSRSFIIITHYHRMLDFLDPDYIHILIDGKIKLSGGPELAHKLEEKGYSWVREMQNI